MMKTINMLKIVIFRKSFSFKLNLKWHIESLSFIEKVVKLYKTIFSHFQIDC